jgi:hypothetical protein
MPCDGQTAETVIDALEDADDYAAFEMAVTVDYDAQTAVSRVSPIGVRKERSIAAGSKSKMAM